LTVVAEFDPCALVVSLGLDTLAGDPVAFPTAAFSLKAGDFAEMGRLVLCDARLARVPKVFFQEGGYLLEDVTRGVLNFFSASK
jgi:acetoin utilization deacetylase AcuC-like enzyme